MTPNVVAKSDTTSLEIGSSSAVLPAPSAPKSAESHEANTTTVGASSAPLLSEKKSTAIPIPIDLLYQARDARSASLNRGLELLSQAELYLKEAQSAAEDGLTAACALHVMSFEDLLQPLFECRAIGDGFANVVNTIHFGIANLEDAPISPDQIGAIWRIIRELSVAPFLTYAESLDRVRQLRKVGITINNSFIQDWVSGAAEGEEN